MAKTKNRLKGEAVGMPQSKEEVILSIKEVGDIQREIARTEAAMNDEIGRITQIFAPTIEEKYEQLKVLQVGIQAWCEVNRDNLTQGGKTKTVNFTTGEVSWRSRPDSVSIKKVEVVLETLKQCQLQRFIRIKEEINKEAILADKLAVTAIPGITINSGKEDFSITPFER